MSDEASEVLQVAQLSCFELVAPHWTPATGATPGRGEGMSNPSELGADWPLSPGGVRLAASGQPEALHFAPGRWLLPDPSSALLTAISTWPAAMLVDVEGKWQRRSLRGSGAMRMLAAGADVEAMLSGRGCAALSLFDCPAIVARVSGAIQLWVQSSYAHFLDEQLGRALSRIASHRHP